MKAMAIDTALRNFPFASEAQRKVLEHIIAVSADMAEPERASLCFGVAAALVTAYAMTMGRGAGVLSESLTREANSYADKLRRDSNGTA